MRLLLAVFVAIPLLAQTPAQTPAQPVAQPPAPAPAPAPAAAPASDSTTSPTPSTEPWITGTVDFGYRFTSVGGDNDVYRSVVNLGQGPRLLGLDLTIVDPKKRLFDHLEVRANNWGGDPYNTLHVNASKRASTISTSTTGISPTSACCRPSPIPCWALALCWMRTPILPAAA